MKDTRNQAWNPKDDRRLVFTSGGLAVDLLSSTSTTTRNKPSRRDHSLSLRIYPGKSTFATLFLLEDKWSMSCGLFSRIRFRGLWWA